MSCVARLNGRLGKEQSRRVLRGSSSKQVIEHRLDQLSTYGLLKVMTQDDITVYMKALIQAGCIAVGRASTRQSASRIRQRSMTSRAEVMLDI